MPDSETSTLSVREPDADHKLPASVEVAIGDLLDPVSIEEAMNGVDKLFLINAVVADELTQALIAYGIAKRIGGCDGQQVSSHRVGRALLR
jgi:uncharacterized protein YbjT (DUF2867 family)